MTPRYPPPTDWNAELDKYDASFDEPDRETFNAWVATRAEEVKRLDDDYCASVPIGGSLAGICGIAIIALGTVALALLVLG